METRWEGNEISVGFDAYQDTLEQLLGYDFVYEWLKIGARCSNEKIILDYGCGPGKTSYHMAESGIGQIIAVDEAESMLKIAQEKRKHPRISYHKITNDNLFYIANDSIDAAILCFVLLNHGNRERIVKILREINRVLKPKGSCIILDTNPDSIGVRFTTFQSGISNKVYESGELRNAWLFLPQNKVLKLTGYHWSKQMYYSALDEAGFYPVQERAPILNKLSTEKLTLYKSLHVAADPKFAAEWDHPPFILFKGHKISPLGNSRN